MERAQLTAKELAEITAKISKKSVAYQTGYMANINNEPRTPCLNEAFLALMKGSGNGAMKLLKEFEAGYAARCTEEADAIIYGFEAQNESN